MTISQFVAGPFRLRMASEVRPGGLRGALKFVARLRTAPDQLLRLPLPFPGPVAILDQHFRTLRNQRVFQAPDYAGLEQFAPEVLVAPLDAALLLADQRMRGRLRLTGLQTAFIVLTTLDESPLDQSYRDLLWSAFGVPVFEQLRGADGQVIARECEVHDGLHLDPYATFPQRDCELLGDPCECGADSPRLRPLPPTRAFAASA